MTYKFVEEYAGYPLIEDVVDVPTTLRALPVPPSMLVHAIDPVWGMGEFIFARASAAIRQYGLCVLTPSWDSTLRTYVQNASEVPNTANLGRAVLVSMNPLSVGQYGWFMVTGIVPVNCSASVAADTTFGIAAAGQGGANSAGKQVLNARVLTAATNTIVKSNGVRGANGDVFITVGDTDGLFPGGFVSGTGVPAGATIVEVDDKGQYVRISAALTADCASFTQTANNGTIFYNVAHINRPLAQGAIT